MARKDSSDTVDEKVEGAPTTREPSSNPSTHEDVRGVTFTAEGGTPATGVEFSDSKQVRDGEWSPETHGTPPDQRPKRNF